MNKKSIAWPGVQCCKYAKYYFVCMYEVWQVVAVVSMAAVSSLCHPYGAGIECTCNSRGSPVHCLPILPDINQVNQIKLSSGLTLDIV